MSAWFVAATVLLVGIAALLFVAATAGRGVWKLTDASALLAAEGVLHITGDDGANVISLVRDPYNRSLLDVVRDDVR